MISLLKCARGKCVGHNAKCWCAGNHFKGLARHEGDHPLQHHANDIPDVDILDGESCE